jgi:hypothetical protein
MEVPEGIKEGNIDGFLKKEYLYQFSMDKWCNQLKEFTIPTQILSFSVDEAKALLTLHNEYYSQFLIVF